MSEPEASSPTTYQIRMMLRDDQQAAFLEWLECHEAELRAKIAGSVWPDGTPVFNREQRAFITEESPS